MKKIILTLSLITFLGLSNAAAQVGIGTNTPNASAVLELQSTDKGFLPPRMTIAQRDGIVTPVEGLTIYNTDNNCLEFFDGTDWRSACDGQVVTTPPPYNNSYVHCNAPTVIVEVLSTTGKIWMDRNLGASRVATQIDDAESYGSLFQWGRGADGHQCVHRYNGDGVNNSNTNSTLSTSDIPGHGDFITISSSPFDWRNPQNDNLWQDVNGTNNPCPTGYRLPTESEWDLEIQNWNPNNSASAFASPLKLSLAGVRSFAGFISNINFFGYYWSSTISSTSAKFLSIGSSTTNMSSETRATGCSVRCIKNL
jgi:hypothetical protein